MLDSCGNENGTITGGVTFTTGKIGSFAAHFDGITSTRVNIGTLDMPNQQQFSISLWFNVDTFSDARLVSKAFSTSTADHIFALQVIDATSLGFRLTTGAIGTGTQLTASSLSLSSGVWYNLVGRYDGSTYALFLNGVSVASAAKTGLVPVSNVINTAIGNQPAGGGDDRPFSGDMDQVLFWNKALSKHKYPTCTMAGLVAKHHSLMLYAFVA